MDSFPLKLLRQLIRNFGVSGYVHTNPEIFLNRIPFYMNRPPAYTKPVNLDTESALFLNRERFKAPSTRIRIKKYTVYKLSGFVWTSPLKVMLHGTIRKDDFLRITG